MILGKERTGENLLLKEKGRERKRLSGNAKGIEIPIGSHHFTAPLDL